MVRGLGREMGGRSVVPAQRRRPPGFVRRRHAMTAMQGRYCNVVVGGAKLSTRSRVVMRPFPSLVSRPCQVSRRGRILV